MSVENPGTDLVPAETNGQLVTEQQGDLVLQWLRSQPAMLTSIDRTTDIGKQYYLCCFSTPSTYLKDVGSEEISVRDWLLHKVKRLNRANGEYLDGLRLVLILSDGRTVATSSGPFINNWYNVVGTHGRATFDPPLMLTVKRCKGSGEGEYLQLAMCRVGEPAQLNAKKK